MNTFPPIYSVLEKARRFRQAGTYLSGEERQQFEKICLPKYLEWARWLYQLGHWTESRCLFQEIQLVKPLSPPYSIIWYLLEQEKTEKLTSKQSIKAQSDLEKENIQSLHFVQILKNEERITEALEEFEKLECSLKNSLAGQLMAFQLKNGEGHTDRLMPHMFEVAVHEQCQEDQQSNLALLYQYVELLGVVKDLKAEATAIEERILHKDLEIRENLIHIPLSRVFYQRLAYKIQRATTIAKDFGTQKEQKESGLLLTKLDQSQEELSTANQQNLASTEKNNFQETINRNFFASYEYTNQFREDAKYQNRIQIIRNLLKKFNAQEGLYLPLLFWEIEFELAYQRYLRFKHLENLLENDDFRQWCKNQNNIKHLSKIKVFISYSTLDIQIREKIVNSIRPYGFKIILDINELKARENIHERLDDLIIKVDYVLLLVSRNSLVSGWVSNEVEFTLMIERVLKKEPKLIPIIIDKLARANYIFFRNTVAKELISQRAEMKNAKKISTKLDENGEFPDLTNENRRLNASVKIFSEIMDMIKSNFALDFYDDLSIALNTPKLIQRILEFNPAPLIEPEKASTSHVP